MVHGLQSLRDWHYMLPLENEASWSQGTVAVEVRVRVSSRGDGDTYRKRFLRALK